MGQETERQPTQHELGLNPRAFRAIGAGTKKVEIRVPTESAKFVPEDFRPGDEIVFAEDGTNEKLTVSIIAIRHYPDVRTLLETEGTVGVLSSGGNVEQGVKSIHSFPGYEENIRKHGVYAIEIALV